MLTILKELISITSPSGFELGVADVVVREVETYGYTATTDLKGNVWVVVGDKSPTLFTAHMDCVHNDEPVDWEITPMNVMQLAPRSKQQALGADDKAGIAILLSLISKGVGGTYIFTVEEEIGCIGAAYAAQSCPPHIKHAVCFDRKACNSIITSMSGGDCCSKEFSQALITQFAKTGLTYVDDPTGSTTDTEKFRAHTLNHTNISAGYYNEHMPHETLDLTFLEKLITAASLIDWDNLPQVERPEYVLYPPIGTNDILLDIYQAENVIEAIDAVMSHLSGRVSVPILEVEDMFLAVQDIAAHGVEGGYE